MKLQADSFLPCTHHILSRGSWTLPISVFLIGCSQDQRSTRHEIGQGPGLVVFPSVSWLEGRLVIGAIFS